MIIGLCYKKSTGKNSFAKFLSTHIRCSSPKTKIIELSFAYKLKDIAYQLYAWAGMKRPVYYESHYEEKEVVLPKLGLSPRQVWIQLGNKCREIYGRTWIDYALNDPKISKNDIIIITDVGFINEAKAIQEKDGCLIKLVRVNTPRGTDPREIELDSWEDWCQVVNNNGTLDDLYRQAAEIWELINEK